jgi:hypothetical protein
MPGPDTPQAAEDAAAEVAKDDALRDEPTDTTWADDRTTNLDPGRVGSDDQQPGAARAEGEPDE